MANKNKKMVCRKPCELIKCTKIVWFSLMMFSATIAFKLSTFHGSDENAEPHITHEPCDQLSIKFKKPQHTDGLNMVNREEKNKTSQSRGSDIIIKQGRVKSSQPLSSGFKEKQQEVRTEHHHGFDIVKGRVENKTIEDKINKPNVYTFSRGSWKISHACKPYKSYLGNINFHLATSISSAGSVKMFVHNTRKDAISSTIMKRHSFEPELVDFVLSLLRKDPQLSLIDIGSNVGLFTMAGALLGRHVLAVDAVIDNIEHVCASVEYQNFTNRVLLINNALSNSHGKVDIAMGGNGDFGLSHVNEGDINVRMNKRFSKYFRHGRTISVDAVKLDDVLNLPRFAFFENMLIKIDVEGNEHRVLLGAKEFMKKKMKSVKGILMEWAWVSGGQSENTILNLMASWNYYPYRCNSALGLLNKNKTNSWPKDVLWLPKDTKWTQSVKVAHRGK